MNPLLNHVLCREMRITGWGVNPAVNDFMMMVMMMLMMVMVMMVMVMMMAIVWVGARWLIQFEATIRTSKAKTPDTSSVEDSSQSEGQIFSTLKSTKVQLVCKNKLAVFHLDHCEWSQRRTFWLWRQPIVPLPPKLTLLLLFTLLLQRIPPIVGLALVRGASSECGQQDAPPYL